MKDCILFVGAKFASGGYGAVRFEGKTVRAHRLAYCKAHGLRLDQIKGLEVRHACDNPPCINPAHLEIGTHTDNMRDMFERNRRIAARGTRVATAKLTEDVIPIVRQRLAAGESQASIGRSYGVLPSTICRIASGERWRHA